MRIPHLFTILAVAAPIAAQAHWSRLRPAHSPSPRDGHGMVFYPASDRCVLFGGLTNSGADAETWLFDGADWTPSPSAGPPARFRPSMVVDEWRNVIVMFGGRGVTFQLLDDTWEWNGSSWTPRVVPVHPDPYDTPACAYDPTNHCTVLFRGSSVGETWTWDGTVWQMRTPAHTPPTRIGGAMAHDPNTGTLVLFGGGTPNSFLDDTWSWNGVDWHELYPSTPPWRRGYHAMVTDTDRRRIVLIGTDGLQDALAWEWDGLNWEQRFLSSPSSRAQTALAYDRTRRQVVLFGGGDMVGKLGDSWVYRTDLPAQFTALGPGCLGSLGIPELANAPYSLPWLGDVFHAEVAPVAANSPVFFVTGTTAAPPIALDPFGMPGCTLFVSVIATDVRIGDAAGVAHWSLPIPNTAALAGTELAQQCLSLDSGNAAGAVVSSARTLRVGIR
jgi:hypothetical protein